MISLERRFVDAKRIGPTLSLPHKNLLYSPHLPAIPVSSPKTLSISLGSGPVSSSGGAGVEAETTLRVGL